VKKQDILENQVNTVYLSLGTNLGNKHRNLIFAKFLLTSLGIKIIKSSSFYSSKSWPNNNFPDFVNIVILIQTKLKLIQLFKKVKYIEKKMGRISSPKNHPRICDIDIIDFNNLSISLKSLKDPIVIPHLSMHKRNFVLIPMYEINKKWYHPKLKKNIVKLISNLSNDDLRGIKII
tara:strand:+ start:448 stop:975 length:528 start_codon:yes stop_codon:yes gene_type:complete